MEASDESSIANCSSPLENRDRPAGVRPRAPLAIRMSVSPVDSRRPSGSLPDRWA